MSELPEYISTQLLTRSINLHSNKLKGDVNELLLKELKKYEGYCNKDGYIQQDSVELINRSMGEIKTINGVSYIVYQVTYKANILSPAEGMKLKIQIDNKTKMGILGYIQLNEQDTMKDSPFIVIVPKEYFKEQDFDKYKTNDSLYVSILAYRITYQSTNIQVVAKPV